MFYHLAKPQRLWQLFQRIKAVPLHLENMVLLVENLSLGFAQPHVEHSTNQSYLVKHSIDGILCYYAAMLSIEEVKSKVKELVNYLRNNNVTEEEIMQLVRPEKKLSRLVVTEDYRIILPDYGNVEIKLEPIHKAVYLLFLKHPEGIRFKELPDYREELAEIYHSMKKRTQAKKKVERSIMDVTDPLNHSIIEKCARIKNAFQQITPHEEYVITGEKGEVRRIMLDRDLVEWK